MNSNLLWFTSRGAGVVSLLLLTGVVCLGVLTSVRWGSAAWPRFLTAQLHGNVALLSVVFLAVHIVSAILDPYVSLGWLSAVDPFSAANRTVWLGLGVIAFDLLAALILTSLARHRIGHHTWRAVHWLAYASWPLAIVHGLGTGSDALAPWMLAIDAVCLGAVSAAMLLRLAGARGQTARALDPAPSLPQGGR